MIEPYRINEIFCSIQAEGFYSGTPAVFIRFAGCNRHCSFCDTDFSIKEKLSDMQILNRIRQHSCDHIILTGGEPSLQNIYGLITYLRSLDFIIHVETNGYNFTEISSANWITFSPKDTADDYDKKYWNELKVVYTGQNLKSYKKYMCQYNYLQPVDKGNTYHPEEGMNIHETIEQVKRNPRWRISLQWQKLINIK